LKPSKEEIISFSIKEIKCKEINKLLGKKYSKAGKGRKEMIEAALFDVDGTLVFQKQEYIEESTNRVLKELGGKKIALNEAIRFWYRHERDSFLEEWGVNPKEFWKIFNTEKEAITRVGQTRKYRDSNVLKELRQEGIKIAFITNTEKEVAEKEAEFIGKEYWDELIAAVPSAGTKPKPHPEPIHKALEALKVKPENALMVGNGEEDILCAKSAGVLDVLIDRGLKRFLGDKTKPSIEIKNLNELKQIIEKRK